MGQVSERYSWSEDSAIKSMEITESADGKKHSALLVAGDHVEKGGLAKIPSALSRYGFSNVFADVVDGRNVLVVDDVKDADKVVAALSNLGVIKGDPQKEKIPVKHDKGSASGWLKKNALNINGVFGVTGHVAMAGTGILQNDKDRMWNGILGTMNPLLLGICGNGQGELEFEPMFEGMRQYFAAEGLQLPVFTEKHKENFIDTAKHFVSGHAVPIAFGVGTLAGYKGFKSALNQVMKGQGGYSRLAAITTSNVGSVMVLTVPEREKTKIEHDKEKDLTLSQEMGMRFKQFASDPVDAIRSAPMFWDGILKFFDNILYGMDTKDEIRKIGKVWANNRTSVDKDFPEKSYEAIAERVIKGFKDLGVTDISDSKQLAEALVPVGRNSSKFGVLGKLRGQGEELLQSMRDKEGFSNSVHQKTMEIFGKDAAVEKGLLKDMESFSRLEEEARIAESPLGKRSPWLAGVTAATFAIATAMEAMASKNRDMSFMQGDMYQKMYALAAKTVNDVTPEDRAFVANKMAVYLAGQPEVHNAGITSERIEQEIMQRVDALNNSPWIIHSSAHMQQAMRAPTPPSVGATV